MTGANSFYSDLSSCPSALSAAGSLAAASATPMMNPNQYGRYHSAAAMRSAYNTGSVSGTGGVSDCAGLQSIGAAITSAATARNSQDHLNHRSAASVAASAAAASMFGPGMGLNSGLPYKVYS